MKKSELTGAALDWAVAKCIDDSDIIFIGKKPYTWCDPTTSDEMRRVLFQPSTNWAQGGPIIERLDGFHLKSWLESSPQTRCEARINNYEGNWVAFGPTPLVAAMRCYVASKLGDEVEIPKELTL